MKKFKSVVVLALFLLVSTAVRNVDAATDQVLELASLFSNNMVLQRQTDAAIWGKAKSGEKVTVSVSWSKQIAQAVVDKEGRWKTTINTPKAGGPFSVTVKCADETIELKNVLSGEVWLCTGQSNMQWKMRGFGADHWREDVKNANLPNIRLCQVEQLIALEEQETVNANWVKCSSQTVNAFSAIGFFFGRELYEELDVPIGLISVNWGGSTAEAWVSPEVLNKEFPEFSKRLGEFPGIIKETGVFYPMRGKKPKGLNQMNPAVLYNSMIKPLLTFSVRGAIWYQGESNVKEPEQYRTLFPSMIKDWRTRWGIGDFPFYFVQIAPYKYKTEPIPTAFLREAQTMALSVSNTGMAVTMDVGDKETIHPKVKKPVAHRLALLALANDYGMTDLVCSGPLYKGNRVEGNKMRLAFDHVGTGLASLDGQPLTHFTIAGADKKFVEAKGVIDGKTIVVRSEDVSKPVAVRFGWGNADITNLSNKEGLPASSFRTDDWPIDG